MTEKEGSEGSIVGESGRHSAAREWYESLLVAGIFVFFVRTFVVQTYQVPTGSMEKTILVGDHLLVNKFAFAPHAGALGGLLPYREARRGDIIVFKKPGDDVNPGNVLVKRAVAGAGDTVKVRDKALLVNDKPAEDSRFWGPIPRDNIFGRPFLLYWSYEAEPNSHIWRGPVAKIRQLASVAVHFFSRTRWDRMFRLVR